MAAGKIRGITIELSGDTSGLSKSLQSANKDIKDTQTQLKDVQKLLKMDPGNVEYRQALAMMEQSGGYTSYGSSASLADCCTTYLCLRCLCPCDGGFSADE